jgi:hypothetical protein
LRGTEGSNLSSSSGESGAKPGIERGERGVTSVLVDLDRLHHAHLLVVHHMAVHHEDAGVVEEARADDDAAAFGRPRHDRGIPPRPIGLRLTDDLERVGVDMSEALLGQKPPKQALDELARDWQRNLRRAGVGKS